MKKFVFLSYLLIIALSLSAQFSITYNKKTGAVTSIMSPNDKYRMKWIFSSVDSLPTYQKEEQDWGLGKYTVSSKREAWNKPADLSIRNNTASVHYKTSNLTISVERTPAGKFFIETYSFRNRAQRTLSIDSLSIYAPFNDNYPDAKTCATNRCNAHVWPGMHSSYVNAIRMGGLAPHLGLVLFLCWCSTIRSAAVGVAPGFEAMASPTAQFHVLILLLLFCVVSYKTPIIYTCFIKARS